MLPRMRVPQEAYRLIKREDPDTALTMSGLRRLIFTNAIPVVRIGRKALIDVDQLISFLSAPPMPAPVKEEPGQIRRVV